MIRRNNYCDWQKCVTNVSIPRAYVRFGAPRPSAALYNAAQTDLKKHKMHANGLKIIQSRSCDAWQQLCRYVGGTPRNISILISARRAKWWVSFGRCHAIGIRWLFDVSHEIKYKVVRVRCCMHGATWGYEPSTIHIYIYIYISTAQSLVVLSR
jgi:hypothetical protein